MIRYWFTQFVLLQYWPFNECTSLETKYSKAYFLLLQQPFMQHLGMAAALEKIIHVNMLPHCGNILADCVAVQRSVYLTMPNRGYWRQRGDERLGDPPPRWIREPLVVRDRDGRPQEGVSECFCVCSRSALLG